MRETVEVYGHVDVLTWLTRWDCGNTVKGCGCVVAAVYKCAPALSCWASDHPWLRVLPLIVGWVARGRVQYEGRDYHQVRSIVLVVIPADRQVEEGVQGWYCSDIRHCHG